MAPNIAELSSKVDSSSMEAIFSILKQQNDALRALEVRNDRMLRLTVMPCQSLDIPAKLLPWSDRRACCIVTTVT